MLIIMIYSGGDIAKSKDRMNKLLKKCDNLYLLSIYLFLKKLSTYGDLLY